MFKLFEVKDGRVTLFSVLNVKKAVLSSLVLVGLIFLGNWVKLNDQEFWKLYMAIAQHFGLEEGVPKNQKKLNAKVEIEVDKAIARVTPEYDAIIREADRKYQPIFIDLEPSGTLCYTDSCKSLEPPMRLCAPWADNCINTHGLQ